MSAFIQQLTSLLHADQADITSLSQVIQQEREALSSRDSIAINKITEHKKSLIQSIDQRAKQKAQLLAKSRLGIRPGKVTEGLRTLNDDQLLILWEDTRTALEKCKEENLTNGLLISRFLQRTNKLMSIIRGQGTSPSLYGQQGKETAYSGSQHIGKA